MKNYFNKMIAIVLSLFVILSNTSTVLASEFNFHSDEELIILDLRVNSCSRSMNLNNDYDLIIASGEQLEEKALETILKSKKPIFIFTSDKKKIFKDRLAHNIETNTRENCSEEVECESAGVNECIFKGYYIFDNKTLPWYLHEEASEEMLINDVKDLAARDLRENDDFFKLNKKRSNYTEIDNYTVKITYVEASVGVSASLRSQNYSNSGASNYRIQVNPRDAQYYDHSTEYFCLEQDYSVCKGAVISYNPLEADNVITITITYPWSISISKNLGGRMDIRNVSGGIGDDHVRWKFKPKMFNHDKKLVGETVAEFNSHDNKKKCHVSFTLFARRTDKRTGESKVRKYTSGTIMSGN